MFPHPKDGQHLPRDAASFSPIKGYFGSADFESEAIPYPETKSDLKPEIVSEMESSFYILVLGRPARIGRFVFCDGYPCNSRISQYARLPGGKLGSCFKRFRLEIVSKNYCCSITSQHSQPKQLAETLCFFFPEKTWETSHFLTKRQLHCWFQGFPVEMQLEIPRWVGCGGRKNHCEGYGL